MISVEVNYRNGIPIGKPIRQHDNDSSFASEYPEVWEKWWYEAFDFEWILQ